MFSSMKDICDIFMMLTSLQAMSFSFPFSPLSSYYLDFLETLVIYIFIIGYFDGILIICRHILTVDILAYQLILKQPCRCKQKLAALGRASAFSLTISLPCCSPRW